MIRGFRQRNYHIASYAKHDASKMVSIAPTPKPSLFNMDMEPEKKKYNYKSNPYIGVQAASIARRNARERNRVKQVNDGFNALRKRLPASVIAALSGGARRGSGKKLSKVDTLKMVVQYIRYLQKVIKENETAMEITRKDTIVMDSPENYEDKGVFGGNSPYSESVSSPVGSDCSSGQSSVPRSLYFTKNGYASASYQSHQMIPMEDDLLNTISWWQQM